MAKVQHVKSARASKFKRSCELCGVEITPGMPYKKLSISRFSSTRIRCVNEANWRGSDMTTSKMATAYAGQEAAEDALDAIDTDPETFDADAFVDEVRSALENASSAASETADEYQEGIDALPYELQSNPVAEESQEKIDALQSYADDLESWSPSSTFDRDDDDKASDEYAEAVEQFVEEVLDEARDLVQSLEY